MYSYEDRMRAVELYIRYDFGAADVVRELGYPKAKQSLKSWYKEYLIEQETGVKHDSYRKVQKYSPEERQAAVDYYLEHGRSLTRTIRKIGYPSRPTLMEWIDELAPGERKLKARTESIQFTQEQKIAAVVALESRSASAGEVAAEIGTRRETLYNWKRQLLGAEAYTNMTDINTRKPPDDPEELEQAIKEREAYLYRLNLEIAIREQTAELIKKGLSTDPETLTNKEKAILIGALKKVHPLKTLLEALQISKSSYFYQAEALSAPDRHEEVRGRIIELFHENEGKYGYRPIHALLKKEETVVSEKVVRSIMTEEHLEVRRKKTKKYQSYIGEVTPAPENIIARDFHAGYPNEKWLTDITEFAIPAGKVYLSPIIDCFDGMAVSWTIGTSPNAEMANSMLEGAISTLSEGEKPLLHSDRGGPYRWPGWIKLMEDNGLTRSMSKKGCSPDNNACEGFFGRTKLEFFYGRDWRGVTIDEFMEMLDDHLHWHNETRIKKALSWMSPVDYRRSLGLAA